MARLIGAINYDTGGYIASPGGYVPYHYEDELRVLPLLGRDPARTDRNEVLMANARLAQICTVPIECATEVAKDALVALWATQTTHDDGSGAAVRNVTVIRVDTALRNWSGALPAYLVTLTLRTR